MNAFANVIVSENMHDKAFIDAHTNGFDEWWQTIEKYTPESVADICGCDPDDIRKAARMYATAPNSIIGWGMGVTQQRQGVKTVHTIAAIACISNQIGRDNAGLAPVRGQNNVQGSCDMGMWPSLLPGYQKVANPEARAKFEKAWGLPEGALPAKEGFKLTDLPHGVKEGRIKAFYNFGEDPLQTEPDSADMKETLENLELLISQDIFMTQTTALADVVFPGTSWGEHDGVFSASDRTFQRFYGCRAAQGRVQARLADLQRAFHPHGLPHALRGYRGDLGRDAVAVPQLLRRHLRENGRRGPCPVAHSHPWTAPGTPTLYKNGQFNTADKKAILMAHDFVEPTEMPDDAYPLVLCTVREVGHYSCRSMTGNCKVLSMLADEPGYVHINPDDAQARNIKDEDLVWVSSRRGKVITRACLDERINKGAVYMTYQWWIGKCNDLTLHVTDPLSGTPEDKYSACEVHSIDDQMWAERHMQSLYTALKDRLADEAAPQNVAPAEAD